MSAELKTWIAVARDPKTPFERLVELFKYSDVEVRRALLDNPNLCPTNDQDKLHTDLLEALAELFPEEVAVHPLFILHALVEPNEEMKWAVKEVVQRTEDVGLIERILSTWGTSWGSVRKAVASNPSTPIDLLRILGNQKTETEWSVRESVAANLNTPVDLLRLLSNPTTESHFEVCAAVASNPITPEDILRTLGNPKTESEWKVRQGVAMNPNTPVDLLLRLGNEATESNGWVREAVASNPSTPENILRTLENEQTENNFYVRKAAQKALADRGLA